MDCIVDIPDFYQTYIYVPPMLIGLSLAQNIKIYKPLYFLMVKRASWVGKF